MSLYDQQRFQYKRKTCGYYFLSEGKASFYLSLSNVFHTYDTLTHHNYCKPLSVIISIWLTLLKLGYVAFELYHDGINFWHRLWYMYQGLGGVGDIGTCYKKKSEWSQNIEASAYSGRHPFWIDQKGKHLYAAMYFFCDIYWSVIWF